MHDGLRSVRSFALVFLALFPLFVAAYGWILPGYQSLVLALANLGLAPFGQALRIESDAGGTWRMLLEMPGAVLKRDRPLDAHALDVLWFNLALLPPLLLATPVGLAARLRLLAIGAVVLVVCHALGLMALAYGWHCVAVGPGGALCDSVGWTVTIHGQLLGGLQWALLTWGHWFALLRSPAAPMRAAG